MKALCIKCLLPAALLSLSDPVLAVTVWSSPTITKLRTGGPASKSVMSASVAVMPVPVVEVVIVADPGAGGPIATDSNSPACSKELFAIRMNATRAALAENCEAKADRTGRTVEALQHADTAAALRLAELAYRGCMSLSDRCAKEVAPQLVQKLRLSGMAVTQNCSAVVTNVTELEGNSEADESNIKNKRCSKEVIARVNARLRNQDIDGAMIVAQTGLGVCHGIKRPCDFQLAPALVLRLMDMNMQHARQEVAELLMSGLKQAQQISAKLESSVVTSGNATHAKGTSAPGRTLPKHRPLSLLVMDSHMRIAVGDTTKQNL